MEPLTKKHQLNIEPEFLCDELKSDVKLIDGQTWVSNVFVELPIILNERTQLNSICNQSFLKKKSIIENNMKLKNYESVLNFLDSHKKFQFFNKYVNEIHRNVSDKRYYKLLKDVITSNQTDKNYKEDILSLIRLGNNPRLMMNKNDAIFFSNLPDKFKIWRGVQIDHHDMKNIQDFNGIHWSLSRDKASWCAKRFENNKNSVLFEVEINKYDVFAFLNERNEQEIVIDNFEVKNLNYKII